MRPALASSAVLLLAACSRAPAPALERFPIGMFGVKSAAEVKAIAEAGIDTFVANAEPEPLAAAARRHGMRMLASPGNRPSSGQPPKHWPMDAWYVFDEPDVVGLSSAAVKQGLDAVKAWDPRTPVAFAIGQGAAAKVYGGLGDALMLDWYPVPHRPTGSVADEIDKAYWYTGGKPLWFLVQAFDWRDWPQRDPKKPRVGRFPDHAEIRLMSYLAVLHGARGLFFYTMKRGDGSSLLDWPELWQAVARVAREMRAMQPIWSENRRIPLPFEPNPDGVEAGGWRWRGRDYIVIANRHPDRLLKVPETLLRRRWRPLFEPRRDARELLHPAQGAFYLQPGRVLVFEGPLSLPWVRN